MSMMSGLITGLVSSEQKFLDRLDELVKVRIL